MRLKVRKNKLRRQLTKKTNGLNPDRNNAALSIIIHRHSLETIVRYEIKWTTSATFFSHSITHTCIYSF